MCSHTATAIKYVNVSRYIREVYLICGSQNVLCRIDKIKTYADIFVKHQNSNKYSRIWVWRQIVDLVL